MQLAGMDAEDAAVAGRENRERQGVDVDAEGGRSGPRLVLPDQDRVVELHGVRELDDRIALVDGDADDLQIRPARSAAP